MHKLGRCHVFCSSLSVLPQVYSHDAVYHPSLQQSPKFEDFKNKIFVHFTNIPFKNNFPLKENTDFSHCQIFRRVVNFAYALFSIWNMLQNFHSVIIFIAPRSLLGGYQNSFKMETAGSSKRLVTPTKHPHNVTAQKTAIRIFTTVKTSIFMSTVCEEQV
jgi:hypothetical protein